MLRPTAETMPSLALPARPKGLPMAITWSPTCTLASVASGIGRSVAPDTATCTTARSVDSSRPTTLAVADVPLVNVTRTLLAPLMTWALVRMSPERSITTPEPSAVSSASPDGPNPAAAPVAVIETTPAWSRAYTALGHEVGTAADTTAVPESPVTPPPESPDPARPAQPASPTTPAPTPAAARAAPAPMSSRRRRGLRAGSPPVPVLVLTPPSSRSGGRRRPGGRSAGPR